MPLNTLRLNHAPSTHPNDRIVFIKPLPRPPSCATNYQTADTLLRAVAAQCLPIMKSHYLSVTTLEEHEPNPEFIGRNFNNGEVIQLVLRSKSGGWLSVNMIQMVMMHELAHNLHMNHGRDFWKTRNLFAQQMRELWAKGYTGDGLWGTGRTLRELGATVGNNVVRSEELKDLPICGGTFRSRGRGKKRKAKGDTLSWREKKERRIEKKFGKNGLALGFDEDKRLSLDLSTKGPMGVKPRVAQSKRGRELRAEAALARFDTNKREAEEYGSTDQGRPREDDAESEDGDIGQEDARDMDGQRILDGNGNCMIKVCDEDAEDDIYVKHEIDELQNLDLDGSTSRFMNKYSEGSSHQTQISARFSERRSLYDIPQHTDAAPSNDSTETLPSEKSLAARSNTKTQRLTSPLGSSGSDIPLSSTSTSTPTKLSSNGKCLPPQNRAQKDVNRNPASITIIKNSSNITCPVCSLSNPSCNPTCTACTHVLDRRKDPRAWSCTESACRESSPIFLNAGDAGICGICGARKAETSKEVEDMSSIENRSHL